MSDERLALRDEEVVTTELLRILRADIHRLDREKRALQERLVDQETLVRERDAALASLKAVQYQLLPFYQAMQRLFGDFEEAGVSGTTAPASGHNDRTTAIWESWKDKLGRESACSKIIDALLHHEEMTVMQLRVACKIGQQTVYDATSKMTKLGLIDRDKGRYRLRKL